MEKLQRGKTGREKGLRFLLGSFIRSSFAENGKRRSYYIVYTLLFFTVAFFCFSWFIFSGKSLIWEEDGWSQHFTALLYYGKYLRGILKNLLLEHRLIIPDWDFCIGEGSDIVNAMHYYVIGDPIAFLSVFVPTRFMHLFYSGSCILRLYLAGISFSALCFGVGRNNRYGILSGALSYTFCTWALLNAARHPYFLNPMIYFPLIILGIERVIKKEKPYLFIVAVAISAMSNFYFFYMIVILTALYTVVRLCFLYQRQIKEIVFALLRVFVTALIGVCVAGAIFLPVLMMFLNDSRLSVSQPFHWFYSMSYYSSLPSIAISNNARYWLYMGYAAPVILSVFVLFLKRKDNSFLKVLFGISVLLILFPIGGRILNGMSYMTNRWSWAFALLCAFILAAKWENLISLTKKQRVYLTALTCIYYAICLFSEKSLNAETFAAISMLLIALMIARSDSSQKNRQTLRQSLLLGSVALSVIHIAFWMFAPSTGNYVKEFKENRNIRQELSNHEATAVSRLTDSAYTRISGRALTANANILKNISSTQYYWSLSNLYMNRYRSELAMREEYFFLYEGYDDRTTPTALAAVDYYVVKSEDKGKLPYGYSFVKKVNVNPATKTQLTNLQAELAGEALSEAQTEKLLSGTNNEYSIYKNDYALPIAYCYDKYVTKEVWESYNPVQKQEQQLEAAYVDAKPDAIQAVNQPMPDFLVPYDIKCEGIEITSQKNSFITTANNAKITLTLQEPVTASEVYVGFSGLSFVPTAKYDLYFGKDSVDPQKLYNKTNWEILSRSAQTEIRKEKFYWNEIRDTVLTVKSSFGTQKKINFKRPDSNFSSGRQDYIVNLGYTDDSIPSVTITFSKSGVYSFDSLRVYGVPMEGFEEKIAGLQKDTLQNITLKTDCVSGNITLSKDKLLCLATPFSTGWKAYIDGIETEVYCLNDRYPGIVIPAGRHRVQFRYQTPYKKAGFFLSLGGILVLAGMICFHITKNKMRAGK